MKVIVPITICSFFLLIFSCKKENIDFQYGSTYYKTSIEQSGLMRYYTNVGELTNAAILNRYYQEDTLQLGYYFRSLIQSGYYDTLTVSSPTEVIVKTFSSPEKYPATKDGRRIIFTRDSILSYSSPDEYTKTPKYYLLQYKPKVYYEWLQSSVRGDYLFGFRGESKTVLTTDGTNLILPLIFYRQRRNGQYPRTDYMPNYLQKDFYKSIIPGDTLTVLEGRIFYDKKQ